MLKFNRTWVLSTFERLSKTFVQAYLTFWMLAAGLGDTSTSVPHTDAFEQLFTMNNLKAAVVAAVLSFFTSVGSTPLGVDKNSPSITVTESPPTLPPRG